MSDTAVRRSRFEPRGPIYENIETVHFLDAIRLAIVGAASPQVAVAVIEEMLHHAPVGPGNATEPVHVLTDAMKAIRCEFGMAP